MAIFKNISHAGSTVIMLNSNNNELLLISETLLRLESLLHSSRIWCVLLFPKFGITRSEISQTSFIVFASMSFHFPQGPAYHFCPYRFSDYIHVALVIMIIIIASHLYSALNMLWKLKGTGHCSSAKRHDRHLEAYCRGISFC